MKFNGEQETKPSALEGNQPQKELNQERGKGLVKEGGKPQQHPKPNPTTPNQTRVGKPNQKGRKNLKKGGQPTIAEILARKPREDNKTQKPQQLETPKPEMNIDQNPQLKEPNLKNQTIGPKPKQNPLEEITKGQYKARGPEDNQLETQHPQKQTLTKNTGTKPKTKTPQEPNQKILKPPKKQQTSRKPNNEGGKQ